jgi:hypothetical protein
MYLNLFGLSKTSGLYIFLFWVHVPTSSQDMAPKRALDPLFGAKSSKNQAKNHKKNPNIR